ncbi:epoxide hydrolase, soluble (sEH) [Rhodotorula kratochvilovae]
MQAHVQSASLALPAHDLVTSARFSPLATHLALASLDHHIRVLHPSPDSPTPAWDHAPREWKAHDGPVLALAWAHPSFGSLLASGGVDGAVHLWTEDEPPSQRAPQGWTCAASLLDPQGTVRDLAFAPPDSGLKLAAVSSDAHLRVWECLDPLALKDWALTTDIDLAALPLTPSSGAPPVQAGAAAAGLGSGDGFGLGGAGSAAGSAGSGSAPFPSVSSAASTASASGGGGGGVGGSTGGARTGGTVESDGGWAVSWCEEAWWGERLAVSSGPNGIVRLFHLPPSPSPWSNFLNLLPSRPYLLSTSASAPSTSSAHAPSSSSADESDPSPASHTPPTSSLAWAPPSGRSFLLLAAGARDGRARVWKVFPPALGPSPASAEGEGEWAARLEVELEPPASERAGGAGAGAMHAARVGWNVTGTVLSTSGGEDGRVRLWKPTYTGQWRQLAVLGTEDAPGLGGGGV